MCQGAIASRTRSRQQESKILENVDTNVKPKIQGQGMTTWWLLMTMGALVGASLEARVGVSAIGSYPLEEVVTFVKGVATVSGLCVCFGYYTVMSFSLALKREADCPLYVQVWNNLSFKLPFLAFVALDIMVHCCIPFACYSAWNGHITSKTAVGGFIFHRMWSFKHSGWRTVFYFDVETVYGFKEKVPAPVLKAMYLSELILVVSGGMGLLTL